MRKLLTIFLVVCTVAPAFAQFNWRVDADFNTRLLSWNVPTGERAEKLITVDGVTSLNNNASNPVNVTPNAALPGGLPISRGDFTYTTGSLDLFNYYRHANWVRENELRLRLDYSGPAIMLMATVSLDNLIRANANQGTGGDQLEGGHSFVQGSGRTPNWGDMLRYSFVEWFARGRIQSFNFYVGNTPDRGKVRSYFNFSQEILRNVVLDDGFHVITPANPNNSNTYYATDWLSNGQDINNLQRSVTTDDTFRNADVPYFMVSAAVDTPSFPLTFQISADPGTAVFPSANSNYWRFNGAVRVSGENVAKRITFDAIYKFRGGDPDTLDNYQPDYNPGGTLQPDGLGVTAHAFGVYANILNVPQFNFALGYSGYLRVYEDRESGSGTITRSGPLFTGIDLRAVYTGIAKTTLTYHGNVSFANVDKSTADDVKVGVWGQNLPPDIAQGWFALYNALSYQYRPNSQLLFSLQAANRLGIITTTGNDSEVKRVHIRLGGGGIAAYQFNANLLLSGGFTFVWVNNSYTNSAEGAQDNSATRDARGGAWDFAVPVRFRATFRN